MPLTKAALAARAREVRLIAMDVDGVLTAGEIIVLESGEEVKFWNARDRLVMAILRKNPLVKLAWITGRSSNAVTWGGSDLGVPYIVQKCHDKQQALADILKKEKLDFKQAAFIGDDLIDLKVMTSVGLAACPVDAAGDIRSISHYISPFEGGRGVVRDVIELVLKSKNQWKDIVASHLR